MSNEIKTEAVRRKRVPMGGRRTRLQLSDEDRQILTDAGWTMRWVNDKDGRLQQALAGGYVHVTCDEAPSIGQYSLTKKGTSLDNSVSLTVSKGIENPIEGFLMKIRTELYNEDQFDKEQTNVAHDEAMSAGKPGGNVVENQYVPEGHVNRV